MQSSWCRRHGSVSPLSSSRFASSLRTNSPRTTSCFWRSTRSSERKELNGKGIFTVTQLSYTFRPRRRPKHLREKREKYHHSLKALAIRERKIHIVGNPDLKIEGTPVY